MRQLPAKDAFIIEGPAGDLEALLEAPADATPTGCAVVCHPHPVHGGAMTNKVTHTLARSFVGVGFATLRFNFRGVGKSAGAFDEGRGEVQDVRIVGLEEMWEALHRRFRDLKSILIPSRIAPG